MPSFQNQFAISLELTKALPAAVSATDRIWKAALQLARELQSSGSDLVVEEDLAFLFGRCSIASNMSSAFRSLVAAGSAPSHIMAGIALVVGAGPTALRAIRQPDSAYFKMTVQCSLLVAVHDSNALAGAISRAFEREIDGAENESRSPPSIEGIRGTLTAIEDQTTSFDWRVTLLAVARRLDLDDHSIHESIPSIILEGLIVMLASVQHFPEERTLLVETSRAACVLVVWAHHVIGLSVLVKQVVHGQAKTVIFGTAPEQVTIDLAVHYEEPSPEGEPVTRPHSVTLLSIDETKLFKLGADADDEYIDSTFRAPVQGIGKRYLERELRYKTGSGKLRIEAMLLSIAFAVKFCDHLAVIKTAANEIPTFPVYDWTRNDDEQSSAVDEEQGPDYAAATDDSDLEMRMSHQVTKDDLYESAKLIFGERNLKRDSIESYAATLHGTSLIGLEMPAGAIASCLRGVADDEDAAWHNVRRVCFSLSVLIYAFAHVNNLHDCGELPIIEHLPVLHRTRFFLELSGWPLNKPLQVCEDDPFRLISSLMAGETPAPDLSRTSLISKAGWSIFLTSITDSDPILVRKGCVSIQRGVPYRNGVYKHFITEAPVSTSVYCAFEVESSPTFRLAERCTNNVSLGKAYVGERSDSFIISLRYIHKKLHRDGREESIIRRTGFNELHSALWTAQRTTTCSHVVPKQDFPLPPECVALLGFGDQGQMPPGRVFICQTAGSKHARWRALIGIAFSPVRIPYYPVLLKAEDTCLRCAVDQALAYPIEPCYLLL